jgi:chromosome segregation ATPase
MKYLNSIHDKSTGKNILRRMLVPFGAIFILLILLSTGMSEEKGSPETEKKEVLRNSTHVKKKSRDKKLKKSEIIQKLTRLKTLNQERNSIQEKQDNLLDEINHLRDKSKRGSFRPGNLMAKKDLEIKAGKLHKALEKEQILLKEQHKLIKYLQNNMPEVRNLLKEEKKKRKKDKKKLEDLENLEKILLMIDKNPEADFQEKKRPGRKTRLNRRNFQQREPRLSMKQSKFKRPGQRLMIKINQMQKRLYMLKNQMDKAKNDLEDLNKIIRRIEEKHPEFFDDIQEEFPHLFKEKDKRKDEG